MVIRIVTPKIQWEWKRLAKELSKQYPSRNKGYPTSHRRVYEVIANMYRVHLRTVYQYLKPGAIKRVYERGYRHLTRHIDSVFPQVFNGNPELPLRGISSGIESLAGIYIKERTLERLLGKYEGRPRGTPIVRTETGNYRLNLSFYNS